MPCFNSFNINLPVLFRRHRARPCRRGRPLRTRQKIRLCRPRLQRLFMRRAKRKRRPFPYPANLLRGNFRRTKGMVPRKVCRGQRNLPRRRGLLLKIRFNRMRQPVGKFISAYAGKSNLQNRKAPRVASGAWRHRAYGGILRRLPHRQNRLLVRPLQR